MPVEVVDLTRILHVGSDIPLEVNYHLRITTLKPLKQRRRKLAVLELSKRILISQAEQAFKPTSKPIVRNCERYLVILTWVKVAMANPKAKNGILL